MRCLRQHRSPLRPWQRWIEPEEREVRRLKNGEEWLPQIPKLNLGGHRVQMKWAGGQKGGGERVTGRFLACKLLEPWALSLRLISSCASREKTFADECCLHVMWDLQQVFHPLWRHGSFAADLLHNRRSCSYIQIPHGGRQYDLVSKCLRNGYSFYQLWAPKLILYVSYFEDVVSGE